MFSKKLLKLEGKLLYSSSERPGITLAKEPEGVKVNSEYDGREIA